MQSIFRLPWGSDALGIDSKSDTVAKHPKHHSLDLLSKLKRKRSDSALDYALGPDAQRRRLEETEIDLPLSDIPDTGSYDHWQAQRVDSVANSRRDSHDVAMDLKPDASAPLPWAASAEPMSNDGAPLGASHIVEPELSPIQQAIEHQFNLEIMIKHRELRLIEQELAKCQTSLEQLRRCEIIPYPGQDGLSTNLSAGAGAALRAPDGHSQPAAPAPWGVTDGPYSRHYSSWLIPDPTFDPLGPLQPTHPDAAALRGDGRPVRNSGNAWAKPFKSRSQRESVSFSGPEATPATHTPTPKAKAGGPLVLKRMSDNQYVKLVCTKCHRSDFSSVQGFLNHCRIAHKIDYKSHEAAAQDCGHILEDHEAELAATAPPPVGSTVRAAAPKAALPPTPVISRVHHLNHNIIPRPLWKRQRLAYIEALNNHPTTPITAMSSIPKASKRGSLVPSAEQPFLSARLAQHGMRINLAAIVAKLGEQIDLGPEPEDIDDSSVSDDAPASRKGFGQAGNRPRPAPLHATPIVGSPNLSEFHDHDLSPRTSDSNPGLVSDHDDDMNSDQEDEASVIIPRAEMDLHRDCSDAMEVDLVVDDDDDHDHGILVRSRQSIPSAVTSPSKVRTKYARRE